MANAVRILAPKGNGIYDDAIILQELLQRKSIDIAFICETRLRKNFNSKDPGYRTYNTDDPNPPYG